MYFLENMNFNIEIFSSIHHKLKKIHKMRQKPEYLHWCQCDLTLAWLLSIELFLRVMLIEWHDIVVPNNLKKLLVFLLSSPVNIESCPKIHSIHQRGKNCHSNCWLHSVSEYKKRYIRNYAQILKNLRNPIVDFFGLRNEFVNVQGNKKRNTQHI